MYNIFPQGGAISGPRGTILTNLGRGPLGDAKYQIKALGLVVSDKKIFFTLPYINL